MDNKDVKLALVTSDWHVRTSENKILLKNLELISKVANDLKPDYNICLGDLVDAEGISRFSVQRFEYGVEETIKEWELAGKLWEDFCTSCNNPNLERHFCLGNHDGERTRKTLYKLKKSSSSFMHTTVGEALDPAKYLKDTTIYDHLQVFKLGDIGFFHGEHHCSSHARKHANEYGMSVMYGHLHTYALETVTTKVKKIPYTATSIPCLCDLNPEYMKNKSSYWLNGFALVYILPNGRTQSQIYVIKNNSVYCNNKLYKV